MAVQTCYLHYVVGGRLSGDADGDNKHLYIYSDLYFNEVLQVLT